VDFIFIEENIKKSRLHCKKIYNEGKSNVQLFFISLNETFEFNNFKTEEKEFMKNQKGKFFSNGMRMSK
jgi:hypothetical protein